MKFKDFHDVVDKKPEPTRRPRPSTRPPQPEWTQWSNEQPDKPWSEWSGNQWSKWSEWSDNDNGRPINTPEPLPEWTPWSGNQWSAWSSTKPSPWSSWSSKPSHWSKWSAWEETMLQNNSTRVRATTRKYQPTSTPKSSLTTTPYINVETHENDADPTNGENRPTVSTAFTLTLTSKPDENEIADMKAKLEANLADSNPFPAGDVKVTIEIVEAPTRRDILKLRGRKRRSTVFEAKITVEFIGRADFAEDVKTDKLAGYVLKDVQLAVADSPSVDQTALFNMNPYNLFVTVDISPPETSTTLKTTTRPGRVINSTVTPRGKTIF